MIRLSKLSDYAVIIVAHLSSQGEVPLSASVIAEKIKLPEPTVAKVLKLLCGAGIVGSLRGANGGYSLLTQADELSIYQVVTAIEGEMALTSCVEGGKDSCTIAEVCPMHTRWDPVNDAIKTTLGQISIQDMMSKQVRA